MAESAGCMNCAWTSTERPTQDALEHGQQNPGHVPFVDEAFTLPGDLS